MAQMTKNALADSLKTLLETRTVDKITISDITEHCGVNRMTFYYHFQDIYDLLEWSWIREANKVLNGKKTYNTWQQGFLDVYKRQPLGAKAHEYQIIQLFSSLCS